MPKGVYERKPGWKPKKVYPPSLVRRVMEAYAAGQTQREIGSLLTLPQKTVWRIMQNHGLIARRQIIRDQAGEKNASWKGSLAKYKALHLRVTKLRGQPRQCEVCGTTDKTKRYDWASLSKRYDDPSDYKRMCRSCHARYDGTIANITRATCG